MSQNDDSIAGTIAGLAVVVWWCVLVAKAVVGFAF